MVKLVVTSLIASAVFGTGCFSCLHTTVPASEMIRHCTHDSALGASDSSARISAHDATCQMASERVAASESEGRHVASDARIDASLPRSFIAVDPAPPVGSAIRIPAYHRSDHFLTGIIFKRE